MSRRNTELLLLCLAAPFVVLLFAMVLVQQGTSLSRIAHRAPRPVRRVCGGAHRHPLPCEKRRCGHLLHHIGLSGIGIAFVTRFAPDLAVSQIIWLFVGIACMVITLAVVRNIDRLSQYKYTFMVLGIILLLSPMIPGLGQDNPTGSRIWLQHRRLHLPARRDRQDLSSCIFMASRTWRGIRELLSVFTVRMGPFHLPDIRPLLPLLLMWGVAMVIVVFEKDLGSAMVFFFVFLLMLYVATGRSSTWWLAWALSPWAACAPTRPSATCRCA